MENEFRPEYRKTFHGVIDIRRTPTYIYNTFTYPTGLDIVLHINSRWRDNSTVRCTRGLVNLKSITRINGKKSFLQYTVVR